MIFGGFKPSIGPAAGPHTALASEPRERLLHGNQFPRSVGTALEFDLALGKAARADENLPRYADQVGAGEFRAGPLVEIVVERVDPLPPRAA